MSETTVAMIFYDSLWKEHELPEGRVCIWRPSAYALVENNNKFLFVRDKNHGKLELPGGGINNDELVLDALVREVFEESGYKIRVQDKNPFYVRENFFYAQRMDEYWHAILLFFRADLMSTHQETKGIDSEEISEVKWLDLKELNGVDIALISQEAFKQAIK